MSKTDLDSGVLKHKLTNSDYDTKCLVSYFSPFLTQQTACSSLGEEISATLTTFTTFASLTHDLSVTTRGFVCTQPRDFQLSPTYIFSRCPPRGGLLMLPPQRYTSMCLFLSKIYLTLSFSRLNCRIKPRCMRSFKL